MASVLDNLSDDDREKLINSVNTMPEGGMPIGMPSTFSDTGRQASGVGEQLDSVLGAPVRQGIHQALTSSNLWDALKQTGSQIGKDPRTAPSGYDIASKDLDINNPYLGAAAATAGDMAQLPMGMEAKGAAAGVEDIARRLGVSPEEARHIMDAAAQRIPSDVFEENMRALKDIKGAKTNPKGYPLLGQGMDYRALQSPSGKVVKQPMYSRRSATMSPEDALAIQSAPALTEQVGLGPKTKTIQLGDKNYQVQDKVNPLSDISRRASRSGGDPQLDRLYKMRDQLDNSNAIEVRDKVRDLDNQIENRQEELYKIQGIDPENLRYETGRAAIDPVEGFEQVMKQNADQKLGNVITPQDLHEGNIGLDKQRNPTIFDTSRFKDLRPENLTPEMKQKILDSNIALPEKKRMLQEALERPSGLPTAQQIEDFKNRPNDTNYKANPIKFVAGKAGVPGEMTDSQKGLASAIAKLQKAKAAGESVGRQTGTDINSFKDLKNAIAPSISEAKPNDDAFIEQHMNQLLEKLKKEHGE